MTSSPDRANYTQSKFYEMGILNACQNVIISLAALSGDADIYARVVALPDALNERLPYNVPRQRNYDWSSTNPGSDSIVFCCNNATGNTLTPFPDGPTLGSTDSYQGNRRRTLRTSRVFIQVLAKSSHARWRLSLIGAAR